MRTMKNGKSFGFEGIALVLVKCEREYLDRYQL
jgi:hypothetical protein